MRVHPEWNLKMSRLSAQATIRDLALKAKAINDDPGLDVHTKAAQLDAVEKRMLGAQAELKMFETLGPTAGLAASPTDFDDGYIPAGSTALPAFGLDEAGVKALHAAVVTHQSLKLPAFKMAARAAVTKAAPTVDAMGPSAAAPPAYVGLVPFVHEPTRVAELIPSAQNDSPSVEYVRHTSTTGTAGVVAAGTLKPSVTLGTERILSRAVKLAVVTAANDEDLTDLGDFQAYLTNELTRLVVDAENGELLSGDGTGEHVQGLLNVTGAQLLDNSGATPLSHLDAIQRAVRLLRTGAAKCAPDGIVLHPSDWENIVTSKDSYGRYLLGEPGQITAPQLWGVPVVQTTAMPAGTCLVGNFAQAAAIHWRAGMSVQANYGSDGFVKNMTYFRAEERLGLIVARPAALVKIVSL